MTARLDFNPLWNNTAKTNFGKWLSPSSSASQRKTKFKGKNLTSKSSTASNVFATNWSNHIAFQNSISDRIEEVETKVTELTESLNKILAPEEVVIRDVSFSQAKKEIRQYFREHHGENITAADIEEALAIDFELASKVCERLEREGKIKGLRKKSVAIAMSTIA